MRASSGTRGPSYTVLNLKNFTAPSYRWGLTASRLEPLRGGSLLFTTKFPVIPGTHFIDLVQIRTNVLVQTYRFAGLVNSIKF